MIPVKPPETGDSRIYLNVRNPGYERGFRIREKMLYNFPFKVTTFLYQRDVEKSDMENKRIFLILAVLITAAILSAGCTTQNPATVTPTPVPTATTEMTTVTTEVTTAPVTTVVTLAPTTATGTTIMDALVADGRFTTLVTALKAAQSDGNLSGSGSFTVFAPTDDAFKKLPGGTIDSLLKNPKGQLTDILLYHEVNRKLMAADIMRLGSINTLEGQSLLVGVSNGVVTVNNANIITPDITCSNGVIQAIDTVLAPQTS